MMMGSPEWKNLWVGNLGSEVSESDLYEVFSEYGAVESVTAYSSRSYAFVFFRRPQDAAAAKLALDGLPLAGAGAGAPLKIEFARPAKPSPRLWVAGISAAVSTDHLHREFSQFGAVVDLKLLRDRSTAFLEFALLRDAAAAAAAMNGKRLAGVPLRVDFLRSQQHDGTGIGTGVSPRPAKRPRNDFIWRGVIAKGGTPVCNARCVPIGNWVGSDLPRAVNCSARTGLETLSQHYAEAVGFEAVFFVPDSEEEFASYTEFVQYLGDKNRAGVAKLDDGTTMFLVPPSHFLTHVLKLDGPHRLYGVVLKHSLPDAVWRQHPHTVSDGVWRQDAPPPHPGVRRQDPSPHHHSVPPPQHSVSDSVRRQDPSPHHHSASDGVWRQDAPPYRSVPPLQHSVSDNVWRQGAPPPQHSVSDSVQRQDASPYHALPPPQHSISDGVWRQEAPPPQHSVSDGVWRQEAPPPQHSVSDNVWRQEAPPAHQGVPPAQQGSSEVDKDQRYQSTLQFAANLLLQIQHKSPRPNQ